MKKIDELLKKVEYFERLACYGDRSSFLKAIAQVTPTVGGTPEAEQYLKDLGPQNTPSAPTPPAPEKINPNVQDMLNRLLDGKIVPLMNDGILGKHTKDALKLFSETYGKPATPAAVVALYNSKNPSQQVAQTPGKTIKLDPLGGARDVGGPDPKQKATPI